MVTAIFTKDNIEIRVPRLHKSPSSDRVFWDIYRYDHDKFPDIAAGLKEAVAAKAIKRLKDKNAWRYGNAPFQSRYSLNEGWAIKWEDTNEG